jgi:hypothetical protein
MKITIKQGTYDEINVINVKEFQEKAKFVLQNIVNPQIEIAKHNSIQLTNVQKAHSNCNIQI